MAEPTCPHIVQDYEGTAFCDLAESGINAIGGRLRMAQKENERLRAALAGMVADHESEFPSHRCGFLAAAKEALLTDANGRRPSDG